MKKFKYFCMDFALILCLSLSACGGGGGGSSSSGGGANTSTTVTGQLQASYINGAKICVEDSTLGTAAEHCDTTKNQGNFSLTDAVGKNLAVLIDAVQVGSMPAAQVSESTTITPTAMSAGNAEKAQRISDIFHQAGTTADNQRYDMSSIKTADIDKAALSAFISGTINTMSIGHLTVSHASVSSYTISGKVILSGAGLSGVTISLAGASTTSTTTNANGDYAFTGAQNGSYTVTPSLTGYTFSPVSRSTTVNGANLTVQDFTASVQPPPVSSPSTPTGFTVTTSSSTQIDLAWTAPTGTVTGYKIYKAGTYLKSVTTTSTSDTGLATLTNYCYYVTAYNSAGESVQTSQLCSTTQAPPVTPTYSISGKTTLNGVGLSGVIISLTGASTTTTTTDANGNYAFSGAKNGSYTVTPSLTGYNFSPAIKSITVNSADSAGQNFSATAIPTYSVSGSIDLSYDATINPLGFGLPGVTVSLIGTSETKTVTTQANSNYTFTGVRDGSYTITPSFKPYTFNPAGITITVSGANLTIPNRIHAYQVAPVVSLPQTGQILCYDNSGTVINCAGTGQDGELRAGVAWPNPRFTDNGDLTMRDNLTGLIWTKDGNVMKTRDPSFNLYDKSGDGRVIWPQALDYIKKLNSENYLGHNDWRLPNVIELESLTNGIWDTWLASSGFYSVQGNYWSSSIVMDGDRYVERWAVNSYGQVVTFDYFLDSLFVWPVRSGQSDGLISLPRTMQTKCYSGPMTPRFYSAVITCTEIACSGTGQDGEHQAGVATTFTSDLTGLMWAGGPGNDTPGPNSCNPRVTKTWQEALDYIKCLNNNNYLGYSDWRMPNKKEWFSKMDFSVTYSIGGQNNKNPNAGYVTSTSYPLPRYAYFTGSNNTVYRPGIYALSKDVQFFYVWPVRSRW